MCTHNYFVVLFRLSQFLCPFTSPILQFHEIRIRVQGNFIHPSWFHSIIPHPPKLKSLNVCFYNSCYTLMSWSLNPKQYLGFLHITGDGNMIDAAPFPIWWTWWGKETTGMTRLKIRRNQPILPFLICHYSYLAIEIMTDVKDWITFKYNTVVIHLLTLHILSKVVQFQSDFTRKREQKCYFFKKKVYFFIFNPCIPLTPLPPKKN